MILKLKNFVFLKENINNEDWISFIGDDEIIVDLDKVK